MLLEVSVRHDFTADEVLLKVGAAGHDLVSSREKSGALIPCRTVQARTSWGPQVKYRMSCRGWTIISPRFVERSDSTHVKTVVSSLGNLSKRTGNTKLVQLGLLSNWVSKVLRETLLQRDRVGDEEISGVVLVDPGLDLGEPITMNVRQIRTRRREREGRTTCSSCECNPSRTS
jgi:hypothetical protein